MANSDTLFTYFATANRFHRLERSLIAQLSLGLGTEGTSYLITDRLPDDAPPIVAAFFGDRICVVDPYVTDEHNYRAVCLPILRNEAIRVARASPFDRMFFCDADTVIVHLAAPDEAPCFATAHVYWQTSADEPLEESLQRVRSGNDEIFSEGNSWFVLHREVFSRLDFNEHIVGYGFEDLDFGLRAERAGFRTTTRCDARVVHMYHPEEERSINWWQFLRNQGIFEAVQVAADHGIDPDWRQCIPLGFNQTEWRPPLYFDMSLGVVVDPATKTIASFDQEGSRLIVKWRDHPPEIFERRGAFIEAIISEASHCAHNFRD